MDSNNSDDTLHSNSDACTAVSTDSGTMCGERSGLQILDEFRRLYESRLEHVDSTGSGALQAKMQIMEEWIKDLDCQNTMLVRTVQELEEAAYQRVKILEDKLKHTSSLLTESMSRYEQPAHRRLDDLSVQIDRLEREASSFKQKIKNLQSDIGGLLELVRRGYYENRWSLEGIDFCELSQADIPISFDCNCESELKAVGKDFMGVGDDSRVKSLAEQLQLLSENEKKLTKYQRELQEKITTLEDRLRVSEKNLQNCGSKFRALRCHLRDDNWDPNDISNIVESACEELERTGSTTTVESNPEVVNLTNQLDAKIGEIERLMKQLDSVEKEALESREALTLEVAEKHDQTLMLKEQVSVLEEQCRQATMQLQFKEDIIREMRSQLKQHIKMKTYSTSPARIAENQKCEVTWAAASPDSSCRQSEGQYDEALTNLKTVKTIIKGEQLELIQLKRQLMELLNTLGVLEKKAYERGLADAHKKLQDMEDLLENYNAKTSEASEPDRLLNSTSLLADSITILSKICLDKNEEVCQLELIIQSLRDKNDQLRQLLDTQTDASESLNISRQDFNTMEEFRVCTVEAQAATEDMREEMASVICNLGCRHQLFTCLRRDVEKIHDDVVKTDENISTVIKYLKDQIEEKLVSRETVVSSEVKLKELKNEINDHLVKLKHRVSNSDSSTDQEKLTDRQLLTALNSGDNFNNLMNNVIDEVDYILCNLRVYIAKDDCGRTLLIELKDQLDQLESNLGDLQKQTDRVLQDNTTAERVYDEKSTRLDKLEKELDDAHTRMQDNLEGIVLRCQQYELTNAGKQCDTGSIEMEQLRNAVSSKDKLLEHKDQIIQIQKDSIQMTQEELHDSQQRFQTKIDAQLVVINDHLEQKTRLLEQSKLQNQTITHLQTALVDAKKTLDRYASQRDRSTIELAVGDVWQARTPTVFSNGDVHDV